VVISADGYLDVLYISDDESWGVVILPYVKKNMTERFPAKILNEISPGVYSWIEQEPEEDTGIWINSTNLNKRTSVLCGNAKEMNGIVGLYNATIKIKGKEVVVGAQKSFIVDMGEYTNSKGEKYYRFYSPFAPFSKYKRDIATYNRTDINESGTEVGTYGIAVSDGLRIRASVR